MVFSDLLFLFVFLPAFALLYSIAYAIDGKANRCLSNAVLILFSLIFYAWGEPVYVLLMLGCVVVNYFCALLIASSHTRRKAALAVGLALNLAALGVFKYAGFFAEALCSCGIPVGVPHIALPIGISFYIFQSISYLVDIYRNDAPVQRNFFNLLLYISMFPQLIAGPIVRYGTVAAEIAHRNVDSDDLAQGMFRFTVGLGKKVILANQLGEIAGQFLDGNLQQMTVAGVWMGVAAFMLQIYFDFSGYSDMAIGMGRCMGFHFPENFDHPYCSKSITEFWRRWHMSLGSFFRDYVYIPLGGNRRHQLLNILIVWMLTGMWHGACWNFILWGLYFGLLLMAEKYLFKRILPKVPSPFLHCLTIFILLLGWFIFYFTDLDRMGVAMATAFGVAAAPFSDVVVESAFFNNFFLWVAAILLCLPVGNWISRLVRNGTALTVLKTLFSLAVLFASAALLVGATNNAFIYTRF